MESLAQGRCLQRQTNTVSDDMEMQSEEASEKNGRESRGKLAAVVLESYLVGNINHSSTIVGEKPHRTGCLEILLSFYYYIGVSPFRVDRNRNIRSSCINKLLNILVTLMAVVYIVFSVRRLAWRIDEKDISQQDKAASYVALVYQFCLLLLHACVGRMLWCKQEVFVKLFRFQDISEISRNLNTGLAHFMVASTCSLTILVPLISTIGGLTTMDRHPTWSFFEILLDHELNFFLGLKDSWDYTDAELKNETSKIGSNVTEEDDNSGIFLNDGNLETIVFGITSMVVDIFQQILSLICHDCFLLSAICLWIGTKQLRDQLKIWKHRVRGNDLDCEIGSQNLADEIFKEHKELSHFSQEINKITNSFMPALIMGNIITMSYFMYRLVTRQWYFALYLCLKLCKLWTAVYFAMKSSKVSEEYYNWFISEDVQEILGFSPQQLQRIFAEMKEKPVGNGSSVFYIDTRFLLSTLGIISTYFYMVTGTGT